MILSYLDRIAEGGFADVFGEPNGSLVFKLFRRRVSDPRGDGVRELCRTETQAFELATVRPELRSHIPVYHGVVALADVVDERETSVAGRYHLDCCYSLEWLAGLGKKFGWIPEEHQAAVERLAERFEAAGIGHVRDGDVFGWSEPDSMKFIDIAVCDVVAGRPSLFCDASPSRA